MSGEGKETGWRCDRSPPILDGSLLVGGKGGPELTPGSVRPSRPGP